MRFWGILFLGGLVNFSIYAQTSVIILDAARGDWNNAIESYDVGVIDGYDYEKDYTLMLIQAIEKELKTHDDKYAVFLTRSSDVVKQNSDRNTWRIEFANEHKGSILISIHLDFNHSNEVYMIIEDGVRHTENSKQLAKILSKKLSSVVNVKSDPIQSSNLVTSNRTLPLLKQFNGDAALYIQFGGIKSDVKSLIKNEETLTKIAKLIVEGIDEYYVKK